MNKTQLASLRTSIARVAVDADAASARFYSTLFANNPELKPLFKTEMGGQGKRLMQMIDTAVFALDQPAMLEPLLRQLGQRHTGYGVRPEDYPKVGRAFIAALEETLGEHFTPDIRAAWQAFYDLAASLMIAGASEPSAPLPWENPLP